MNDTGKAALLLGVFTLLCTTLVGLTWWLTGPQITRSEQRKLESRLATLLPPASYDNELHENQHSLATANGAVTAYLATENGQPVAAIYEAVSGEGYAGEIRLLVGVYKNGEVSGVRVLSHRETPGLGDDIELSRSDWIEGFNGKSLDGFTREDWRVEKDGGIFDQFTGATITPRAVVNAVYNVLHVHDNFSEQLFD